MADIGQNLLMPGHVATARQQVVASQNAAIRKKISMPAHQNAFNTDNDFAL